MRLRSAWVAGAGAVACAASAAISALTSCSSSEQVQGELVVAVTTDVTMPKDLDHLHMQVISNGQVYYDTIVALGAPGNTAYLPATLHVTAADATQPVTIRAYARKGAAVKVLREVVTTVPSTRSALLRMPLQFLSFGSAQLVGRPPASAAIDAVDQQPVATTCADPTQTNVAGTCTATHVDAASLPTFQVADVFGGGDENGGGTCFDVLPCFATSVRRDVSTSDCTIDATGLTSGTANVALETGAAPDAPGFCNETTCLVPLDFATQTGWSFTSGNARVSLPRGVCDALAAGRVAAVRVSNSCETKLPRYPACGPWSIVGQLDAGGSAIEPDGGAPLDGGGDATIDAPADAPGDAPNDASEDAGADAPADSPADAPLD